MNYYRNQSEKERSILLSLEQYDTNLWNLRELALSRGGLLRKSLRAKAWPKLLGLSCTDIRRDNARRVEFKRQLILFGSNDNGADDNDNGASGYLVNGEQQLDVIEKDVYRCSFIRKKRLCDEESLNVSVLAQSPLRRKVYSQASSSCNNNANTTSSVLEESSWFLPDDDDTILLTSVIVDVIRGCHVQDDDDEKLHYYQGFHNIAAIVLMNVKNASLATCILQRIVSLFFRDAMRSDFSDLKEATNILFPLLKIVDREIFHFLLDAEMEPSVVTSYLITWFSHEIKNEQVISRLFDCMIASHPLFPMYIFTAILIDSRHRDDILSSGCDFASVHMAISSAIKSMNVSEKDFDTVEDIIQIAINIMERVPAQRLIYIASQMSLPKLNSFQPDIMMYHGVKADWVDREQKSLSFVANGERTNRKFFNTNTIRLSSSDLICFRKAMITSGYVKYCPRQKKTFVRLMMISLKKLSKNLKSSIFSMLCGIVAIFRIHKSS